MGEEVEKSKERRNLDFKEEREEIMENEVSKFLM